MLNGNLSGGKKVLGALQLHYKPILLNGSQYYENSNIIFYFITLRIVIFEYSMGVPNSFLFNLEKLRWEGVKLS